MLLVTTPTESGIDKVAGVTAVGVVILPGGVTDAALNSRGGGGGEGRAVGRKEEEE